MIYTSIAEAINAIPFGKCNLCKAEHTFPNVKCDLMIEQDEQLSWSELAELTHETQVDKFGFCSCEDTEWHEHPYLDCPKTGE